MIVVRLVFLIVKMVLIQTLMIYGICYPSEDGYCANFNYNNLFNSSSDECLNLDEDFCTGGCYWNVDDEVVTIY